MSPSPLHLIPLGGSGEIGMNLNLYGTAGRWLMVDCGISFERTPGGSTRVVMPDLRAFRHDAHNLVGIVITHIHEDHIGAVVDLWPQLRAPVHCTPFAAAMLRLKLRDAGYADDAVPIHVHPVGSRWQLGPFDLQTLGITHSTAESTSVLIRTDAATVLHTGDFKLDPGPMLGPATDLDAFSALAPVDICVSDSTNALLPGRSASEATAAKRLRERVAGCRHRVVVATFASNLARLQSIAAAATATGRHLVVLGRSLHRMIRAARDAGYFQDFPPILPPDDVGFLPRDKVMIIATGTQAEPGAALTRIASDQHRDIRLEPGDTVLFSSKIIPGNEDDVALLHARLRDLGCRVVSEREDATIHASGHPCQDELSELYDAVQPRCVVPVHGTPQHLRGHAAFARSRGLHAVEVRNGDVLHLGPGEVRRTGEVSTGRVRRDERPQRR